MPYAPDKVLINDNDFAADAKAMRMAFLNAQILGNEIIAIGKTCYGNDGIVGNQLLQEHAQEFLAEQEGICADLDQWMELSIKRQRELNDKQRRWLDQQIPNLP